MNVETSTSVYSLITAGVGELERVERYLYDHTKVVSTHENEKYLFIIVKTTANAIIDADTRRNVHSSTRDLVHEAFYLANYQLDRLSSGLIGGILAGSKIEAEHLLAEVAV